MKQLGIILIVLGAMMFIFRGFSYIQEKKVADIGPIEINKKETKNVDWPGYVSGLALIAGIGILVFNRKND